MARHPWAAFEQEYLRIRGEPYARAARRPFYFGAFPDEALQAAAFSAQHGFAWWQQAARAGTRPA
jgi:hypothetical protein